MISPVFCYELRHRPGGARRSRSGDAGNRLSTVVVPPGLHPGPVRRHRAPSAAFRSGGCSKNDSTQSGLSQCFTRSGAVVAGSSRSAAASTAASARPRPCLQRPGAGAERVADRQPHPALSNKSASSGAVPRPPSASPIADRACLSVPPFRLIERRRRPAAAAQAWRISVWRRGPRNRPCPCAVSASARSSASGFREAGPLLGFCSMDSSMNPLQAKSRR